MVPVRLWLLRSNIVTRFGASATVTPSQRVMAVSTLQLREALPRRVSSSGRRFMQSRMRPGLSAWSGVARDVGLDAAHCYSRGPP